MEERSLGNSDINTTKSNTSDLVVFGNGDMFKLLCKASSKSQGFMKSSKAMEIPGIGCVVQATTQQKNQDGSFAVAEAMVFVPFVHIVEDKDEAGIVIGRSLVENQHRYAELKTQAGCYSGELAGCQGTVGIVG